jgi:hypothetical protein
MLGSVSAVALAFRGSIDVSAAVSVPVAGGWQAAARTASARNKTLYCIRKCLWFGGLLAAEKCRSAIMAENETNILLLNIIGT